MCDLVLFCFVVLHQGVKHAGRMWPTMLFCAASDAFW